MLSLSKNSALGNEQTNHFVDRTLAALFLGLFLLLWCRKDSVNVTVPESICGKYDVAPGANLRMQMLRSCENVVLIVRALGLVLRSINWSIHATACGGKESNKTCKRRTAWLRNYVGSDLHIGSINRRLHSGATCCRG